MHTYWRFAPEQAFLACEGKQLERFKQVWVEQRWRQRTEISLTIIFFQHSLGRRKQRTRGTMAIFFKQMCVFVNVWKLDFCWGPTFCEQRSLPTWGFRCVTLWPGVFWRPSVFVKPFWSNLNPAYCSWSRRPKKIQGYLERVEDNVGDSQSRRGVIFGEPKKKLPFPKVGSLNKEQADELFRLRTEDIPNRKCLWLNLQALFLVNW